MNKIKKEWIKEKWKEAQIFDFKDIIFVIIWIVSVLGLKFTSRKKECFIELFNIKAFHNIRYDSTKQKLSYRIKNLELHRESVLKKKALNNDFLQKYIPSVTPIKIIELRGKYVSFDGSSRIMALQTVFTENNNIKVEVILYTPSKINIFYQILGFLSK